MLDFLRSMFPSLNSSESVPNLKASRWKVKKRSWTSPLLQDDDDDEMERILWCCNEEKKFGASQVKILMRREVADRLLSRCKYGGILGFKRLQPRDDPLLATLVSSKSKNE